MSDVFTQVRGDGSPGLLFIHGLTCDHTDWDDQVAYFESTHRCITVDLPGHGVSPARGRALGIERFIRETHEAVAPLIEACAPVLVFGHSMGCRVALGVTSLLGNDAAGVVLVDGSRHAGGDPQAIREGVLEAVAEQGVEQTLLGIFEPMFNEASPAELVTRAMDRALAMDPALAPELLADLAAWDAVNIENCIRSIAVPIMAIQSTSVDTDRNRNILKPGEDSDFTGQLRIWSPAARLELLPGVGHFTMNEAASEVNTLVESFLRDIASG